MLFGPFFAAVKALRRRSQFRYLRDQQGAEQFRVQLPDRASQPYVKEIAQTCIADIVVVRRIRAYEEIAKSVRAGGSIDLVCIAELGVSQLLTLRHNRQHIAASVPSSDRLTENVGLCEIPHHRNCLPTRIGSLLSGYSDSIGKVRC